MTEPDFTNITAMEMKPAKRARWYKHRGHSMIKRGATYLRASVDSVTQPRVTLLEGWIVVPDTMPAPKFRQQRHHA